MDEKRLSVRLSEEEWSKLIAVENRARQRNRGYAPLAHVVKELMGLRPMNLITEEDRLYLSDPIKKMKRA